MTELLSHPQQNADDQPQRATVDIYPVDYTDAVAPDAGLENDISAFYDEADSAAAAFREELYNNIAERTRGTLVECQDGTFRSPLSKPRQLALIDAGIDLGMSQEWAKAGVNNVGSESDGQTSREKLAIQAATEALKTFRQLNYPHLYELEEATRMMAARSFWTEQARSPKTAPPEYYRTNGDLQIGYASEWVALAAIASHNRANQSLEDSE